MLYCEAGIVVSIINFKDRLNDSNSIKKKMNIDKKKKQQEKYYCQTAKCELDTKTVKITVNV